MPLERVQLSEFTIQKPKRRYALGSFSYARRKAKGVEAGPMLAKLGISALLCAGVLLLSLLGNGGMEHLSASGAMEGDKNEFDESLGKLKFVELPGILEVFASTGKVSVDVSYNGAELIAGDTTLMLVSAAAQTVSMPVNGRVKAVGEDETLGSYVLVTAAGDSELQYYGLSSIAVEEGQSLKALDSLGVIGKGEALFIKVSVSGRPENPAEFFELKGKEGGV